MSSPRFLVLVRTFNRPSILCRLIHDLARERPANVPLEVVVFDDNSTIDTTVPQRMVRQQGWSWVRHARNHGKKDAWRAFNTMFRWVQERLTDADLVIFLDDDMRLCSDFFARVARTWKRLNDPRKATLHLMVDASRQGGTCWTGIQSQPHNEETNRIQWVDGAFCASSSFFRALNFTLQPVPAHRWARNPTASTGVGRQLSQRLVTEGYNLYQVKRSLLVHADVDSRMNPGLRESQRLDTVDFVDGEERLRELARVPVERIEASVASIPERHKSLQAVLQCLRPQVDLLRVYLNGYRGIPKCVRYNADEVAHSDQHGDRGDVGKFFWCESAKGVQLIVDDDIAYPPTYAAAMREAIRRYDGRAAVGVHGVILQEPMNSYYRDRRALHFGAALEQDTPVHVLGTGCLAYHATALELRLADFELPNMADVWFSLAAQRQKVPLRAVARPEGWLQPIATSGPTIYDTHVTRGVSDAPQTEAIRRIWPWTAH